METLEPTLPIFFFMYVSIYLFSYYVIYRNWSPKHRSEASSCTISLAHGTPAVLLAVYTILTYTQTPYGYDDYSFLSNPNSTSENIVLEYSIAYFFTDFLHYMVFYPNDVVFIGHHLATLFVFATCRFLVGHGALAILALLVIAEVTSGFQNIWTLAYARSEDMAAAAKLYEIISPVFYVFYTVARGVFGPMFVYKMGRFYLSGVVDEVIPRWIWVSWMLVIVAANLVSILWISNCWICWFKEKSNRACRKQR